VSATDAPIRLHRGDLPEGLSFPDGVAVDTETTGLRLHRDRLCLVQLSAGDGVSHLVQFPPSLLAAQAAAGSAGGPCPAPRLKALLTDPGVIKIFHFARFDVGMLLAHLNIVCEPVYCTKIASRLVRTYTDRHGLKDLCRELLGVELSKEQQSSDWGAEVLTPEQQRYAANDVLHLHRLKQRLDAMLIRESRFALAQACFDFLPHRARLDLAGWPDEDIFAY
jgi:ribonuclease D